MTTSLRRREHGFTLIEVLLASSLFIVLLSAALTSFNVFERTTRTNNKTADQVNIARTQLDRAARQLRNLARRIDVPVIERATSEDLIFQTSSPTRVWVRYCLQTGTDRSQLWMLETDQPTPGSVINGGAGSPCPGNGTVGSGGLTRKVMAVPYVRNGSEPVFRYTCSVAIVGCPRAAQLADDSTRLKSIEMTLRIDVDPTKTPAPARVSSAVFLRNQNEPPTADFVATTLGNRKVLLNGSSSLDPEGRTLQYFYFKGTSSSGSDMPAFTCQNPPITNPNILRGIAPTYTFPTGEPQAYFTLRVCDAGDLQATSATKLVRP